MRKISVEALGDMYTIILQTQTRPWKRVWVYLLQCRRLSIHHIDGNGFIVCHHGLSILWRSVGISHQESTFFIRMQSAVDGIEADVFHKRMVITHRKDLCQGDYLIDDRGKHGTSEFGGEWIEFGSEKFPDWTSVLNYLLPQS